VTPERFIEIRNEVEEGFGCNNGTAGELIACIDRLAHLVDEARGLAEHYFKEFLDSPGNKTDGADVLPWMSVPSEDTER
jgi:hypothetical protein